MLNGVYVSIVLYSVCNQATACLVIFVQMNKFPDKDLAKTSKALQTELKKRFKKYTDPSHENFEQLFIVGTALDPRYRFLLNPVQTSCAKSHLLSEVCYYCF